VRIITFEKPYFVLNSIQRVIISLCLDLMKERLHNSYHMLLAMVIHSGSAGSGHYYSIGRSISDAVQAFNRNDYMFGNWIKYDDTLCLENVSNVNLNKYLQSRGDVVPYSLTYYKVDTINVSNNISFPAFGNDNQSQISFDSTPRSFSFTTNANLPPVIATVPNQIHLSSSQYSCADGYPNINMN